MRRELNFEGTSPLLYLIATPIGNLSEFSPRAIEIVSSCDFVAAEDTRNAKDLLSKYGIKDKRFIACHEHNEEEASQTIISLLKEGQKGCYMSDAGYPAVSDPGFRLVRNCIENDIKVSTVSGPNAGLNALAASGLDSTHFYFYGFLPSKPSERRKELEELKARKETIIFYEAPHRIGESVRDMHAILGNRKACMARELTKAHEEFIRGSLEEIAQIDPATIRGEIVLIIEGNNEVSEVSDETIVAALKEALKDNKSKTAIAEVSSSLGIAKNRVYRLYLDNFKD